MPESGKSELPAARQPVRENDEDDRHERGDAHETAASPERLAEHVVDEADLAALGLEEKRVQRAHRESPDDRSPQAPDTANDEHRQRQEREVEVDVACLERSGKVHEQPPAKPGERSGQGERPETLAMDVYPCRSRCSRILAGGA